MDEHPKSTLAVLVFFRAAGNRTRAARSQSAYTTIMLQPVDTQDSIKITGKQYYFYSKTTELHIFLQCVIIKAHYYIQTHVT